MPSWLGYLSFPGSERCEEEVIAKKYTTTEGEINDLYTPVRCFIVLAGCSLTSDFFYSPSHGFHRGGRGHSFRPLLHMSRRLKALTAISSRPRQTGGCLIPPQAGAAESIVRDNGGRGRGLACGVMHLAKSGNNGFQGLVDSEIRV